MSDNKKLGYDVFIAYHGTYNENGSYAAAKEIANKLKSDNIDVYLHGVNSLPEDKDVSFCDTYRMISKSSLFLLVINDSVPIDSNGFVAEKVGVFKAQLKQELDEFQRICDCGQRNKHDFNCIYFGDKAFDQASLFCINLFPKLMGGHNSLMLKNNTFDNVIHWIGQRINSEKPEQALSNLNFTLSDKFLYKEYVKCTAEKYRLSCALMSHRMPFICSEWVKEFQSENMILSLYERICKSQNQNILKIYGAGGLDKSRFAQLLFLTFKMKYESHQFEPIYISLSYYECYMVTNDLQSKIRKDIAEILKIKKESARKLLLFIDGLKDYKTSSADVGKIFVNMLKEELDNIALREGVSEQGEDGILEQNNDFSQIVCINTDFVENPSRKISNMFQLTCKYEYEIAFHAINTHNKSACEGYLRTYFHGDEVSLAFNRINKLKFIYIDRFVIETVKKYIGTEFTKYTIYNIYTELLENLVGDTNFICQLAEIATAYMFYDKEINCQTVGNHYIWKVFCRHKSIMDFLVAYNYISKLRQADFSKIEDKSFFEIIMPKEITRFIMPAVNEDPALETQVISLSKLYNTMGILGKSEISFLLGRIVGNEKRNAIQQLETFYSEAIKDIAVKTAKCRLDGDPYDYENRKIDKFLLRGITVSLIYNSEKMDTVINYVEMLITDELANKINRGFHLEYYGDKKYLPSADSTLDFEDNLNVGEITLTVLCNTVNENLEADATPHVTLLELFTVCSLLQSRIAHNATETIKKYRNIFSECLSLIKLFMEKYDKVTNLIESYFMMIYEDFNEILFNNNAEKILAKTCYGVFSKSPSIKRTGWVKQEIPDPENITDHMFNCWLFAVMNLPESYGVQGYDKNKIANMLLIHDLAETVLGDVSKPDKLRLPIYIGFDEKENKEMMSLLLKYTYGFEYNMKEYVLAWDEWYKMKSFNAHVAKDIDIIQAVYTFGLYFNAYEDKFKSERVKNWLSEEYSIKTDLGKKFFKIYISDNPTFKKAYDFAFNDK